MMRLRGRPIGVWIAVAYLLALVALAVVNLAASISGTLPFVALALIVLLSSVGLLFSLSRWAVLPIAVQTALQVWGYLTHLVSDQSRAIEPLLSAGIAVYAIQYNLAPLVYLAGSLAVFLYTAWLWRAGILR